MNTSIEELNIEYKDLVAKIVQAEDELRVLQKERYKLQQKITLSTRYDSYEPFKKLNIQIGDKFFGEEMLFVFLGYKSRPFAVYHHDEEVILDGRRENIEYEGKTYYHVTDVYTDNFENFVGTRKPFTDFIKI
jgi:hypothetical protein